jgi:hypothetical protein
MRLYLSLLILLPVVLISAYPEQKASIVGNGEVDSTNSNGETDDVKLDRKTGKANGKFHGRKGDGKYSAEAKDAGNGMENTNAIGPNGQTEKLSIDKKKHKAHGISDKGKNIDADASNSGQIKTNVQGDKNYDVDRPKPDVAIVHPEGGGKQYEADGLNPGMHDVLIKGGPLPIRNQYDTKDADGDGKPDAINTRETEELLPGVGTSRDVNTVKGDGAKTDGSITGKQSLNSPIGGDKIAGNPLLNPQMTVTQNHVEALPCYGDGNDDLGKNGFKIVDDKFTVEYPPSGKDSKSTSYKFPSCITVKAKLQIPPGTNMKDVGAQALVYVHPIGQFSCDSSGTCKHQAAGAPSGPCFFCDFCDANNQRKYQSSMGGDANVCKAVPGSTLPLVWKMCPPQTPTKGNGFQKNLFADGQKGDVDTIMHVYLLKGGKWTDVGCRKARLSYKVSVGGKGNVGNGKEALPGLPSGGGGTNGLGGLPKFPSGGGLPGFPGLGRR